MTTPCVFRLRYAAKDAKMPELEEDRSKDANETIGPGSLRETMINADCPIQMIVDYIRDVVGLRGEFDLYDECDQKVMNIHAGPPNSRGTDIFKRNGIYSIAKVERDTFGDIHRVSSTLPKKGKSRKGTSRSASGPRTSRRVSKITQEKRSVNGKIRSDR